MTRNILSAAVLSLTLSSSASANDIVDFLRALSGPAPQTYRHHDVHSVRGHGPFAVPVGLRGSARDPRFDSRFDPSFDPRFDSRFDAGHHRSDFRGATRQLPRSRFDVAVNIGPDRNLRGPIHRTPLRHAPMHHIGEVVTCPVPLEHHVVVRNACDIAPRSVPTVVAIRNPHLPAFGTPRCIESLVYVEVMAPNRPPRDVIVSPCQTKICLDYGRYEIHVQSCHGMITVTYSR